MQKSLVLVVLALLFTANGMVHWERLGWSDDTAAAGHLLAFDVFVVLIALIGAVVMVRRSDSDDADNEKSR